MVFCGFLNFLFCVSITLLFISETSTENQDPSSLPIKIGKGIKELQNSLSPTALKSAVEDFLKITDEKLSNEIFCTVCNVGMKEIINFRLGGASKEEFRKYLNIICPIITQLEPFVCSGYINLQLESLIFIIDNRPNLTPERVCGIVFQNRNCFDPNRNRWTIKIDGRKHGPKKFLSGVGNVVKKNSKIIKKPSVPLKILHLSDIHYDPEYVPGSNANCGLGICCQNNFVRKNKNFQAAGYWGDYLPCDTPWHTITDLMQHLKKDYGENYFDLIYFTGDIVSHKSWATSKGGNLGELTQIYQLFKQTFGNSTVLPTLGNHEPSPANFFTPDVITDPSLSTKWIVNYAADEWSYWLPREAQETLRKGGFYTLLIKPGFRVIALNANVCFTQNYWLIFDDEDPYGQLKWLVQILNKAERNDELVHIITHVPPGNEKCLQQWTLQFRRIVERFAHIIAGQFNGHTHCDEFRVFYDSNKRNKVINVAFNGGSVVTFPSNNPNYRIYSVDQQNLQVLDYDQHIFNLTLANQDNSPTLKWFKYYSFKQAYGLKNLKYNTIKKLLERMAHDKNLQEQYFRFRTRGSITQPCNDDCLKRLVCHIKSVEAKEAVECGKAP